MIFIYICVNIGIKHIESKKLWTFVLFHFIVTFEYVFDRFLFRSGQMEWD